MTPNKPLWEKEDLEILKNLGANSSRYELAKLIKKHSLIAISIKCRRLGIHKTKEFKSEQGRKARSNVQKIYTILNWDNKFEDLSYETQQILIGSLLGDGFISLNAGKSKEYCFRIGHGEAQKEYLLWKSGMLKELSPKISSLEMFTPTHPIFTKLREAFYKNSSRKNNLINNFVPLIDWLGFLIWYLDDGSLQSRGRDITITSKLFDNNQIEKIISIINKKLGLHLTFKSYNHKGGLMKIIRVSQIDREKVSNQFKELFDKYILPKVIYYKLDIKPIKINTHPNFKKGGKNGLS